MKLVFTALVACAAFAAESSGEQGVRKAAEAYLMGQATGLGAWFEKSVHPEARFYRIQDGRLTQRTGREVVEQTPGLATLSEARARRSIRSVLADGDIGLAVAEVETTESVITMYLSMLQLKGEWKIVSRVSHHRRLR